MSIVPHSSVMPSSSFQFPFNTDIQSLIFDFVGVNKDLANCRFVSKDTKKSVHIYLETVVRMKAYAINRLRPEWEELQRTISPTIKENIEIAEVRKVIFDSFDKNSFYRSMRILAKINNPSECTRDGVLAVMHLLTDEKEVATNGGALDWKYFRKRLLNRNFLKTLRTVKPEDITKENVARFEAFIGMEVVTECNLGYASGEAKNIFMWAVNIVEYKEFLDTLSAEVKNMIAQFEVKKEKEKELEVYENILRVI